MDSDRGVMAAGNSKNVETGSKASNGAAIASSDWKKDQIHSQGNDKEASQNQSGTHTPRRQPSTQNKPRSNGPSERTTSTSRWAQPNSSSASASPARAPSTSSVARTSSPSATASRQPRGPTRTGSGHFQGPKPESPPPASPPSKATSPSIATTTNPLERRESSQNLSRPSSNGGSRRRPAKTVNGTGQSRWATSEEKAATGGRTPQQQNRRDLPPHATLPTPSTWASSVSAPTSSPFRAPSQLSPVPATSTTKVATDASATSSVVAPVERNTVVVSEAKNGENRQTSTEKIENLVEKMKQLPPPVPIVTPGATSAAPSPSSKPSTNRSNHATSSNSRPPPTGPRRQPSSHAPIPTSNNAPSPQSRTPTTAPISPPSTVSPSNENVSSPRPPAATKPTATPAQGVAGGPLAARSLMPDRNRVSSGGARKEKKTPEELDALMASMRLKNEAAMQKRAKAEEDRKAFEIVAEQERKRAEEYAEAERKRVEEMERLQREEKERVKREERERKERTLALQKSINAARDEAAQRKLALIQGRAWDAEKLDRERDPIGEGGSGRELQYPSLERRSRREFDEAESDEEREEGRADGEGGWRREVVSEEERRRIDGVRNDELAWETVEHFEGKGRAQLVTKGT